MSSEYDNRFDKLEEKLDKLDNRLDGVHVTLVKQHSSLAEHMRRTELLENALIPVKEQQAQIIGAGKLVAMLGVIASIVSLIYKIFGY